MTSPHIWFHALPPLRLSSAARRSSASLIWWRADTSALRNRWAWAAAAGLASMRASAPSDATQASNRPVSGANGADSARSLDASPRAWSSRASVVTKPWTKELTSLSSSINSLVASRTSSNTAIVASSTVASGSSRTPWWSYRASSRWTPAPNDSCAAANSRDPSDGKNGVRSQRGGASSTAVIRSV